MSEACGTAGEQESRDDSPPTEEREVNALDAAAGEDHPVMQAHDLLHSLTYMELILFDANTRKRAKDYGGYQCVCKSWKV